MSTAKRLLPSKYIVMLCAAVVCINLTPLIFVVPLIQGCQAPSAQRQTYNTIWSTATTVNDSYRAFLDLVIAGQIPTNSVPQVAQRYGEFQMALNAALLLVASNTNAPPPPALTEAAQAFTVTINAANP